MHNVMLTLQGDRAQNYFALRSLDAEIATVNGTLGLRNEQLKLTHSRLDGGIGNEFDVSRAETVLATTEAELATLLNQQAETGERTRPAGGCGLESDSTRRARGFAVRLAGTPPCCRPSRTRLASAMPGSR